MEPTTPVPQTPLAADERATLDGVLRHYRTVVRRKAEGLTDDQLRTRLPGHASPLSIGGIVKHLASVEVGWALAVFRGMPETDVPEPWRTGWTQGEGWEWDCSAATSPQLLAAFDDAVQLADDAYADAGLDDLGVRPLSHENPERASLRWILVHLVEEHARHAGHLDLLREHVDGVTGD